MTLPPPPHRLRRAETILRHRTSRLVLVMERPWNDENVQAVLRTAESFGVQHVWTIEHPNKKKRQKKKPQRRVTKGSHLWLTRRNFTAISEFLAAVKDEGLQLWSTDLAPGADELTSPEVLQPFPERVAVVVGRELQGVSEAILEASDRRLFLPMRGFTESYNLSVATALVLQRCFDADPTLAGAMGDEERTALRFEWFERLAGTKEARLEAFKKWAETPIEPLDDLRPSEEARKPRLRKSELKSIDWED